MKCHLYKPVISYTIYKISNIGNIHYSHCKILTKNATQQNFLIKPLWLRCSITYFTNSRLIIFTQKKKMLFRNLQIKPYAQLKILNGQY